MSGNVRMAASLASHAAAAHKQAAAALRAEAGAAAQQAIAAEQRAQSHKAKQKWTQMQAQIKIAAAMRAEAHAAQQPEQAEGVERQVAQAQALDKWADMKIVYSAPLQSQNQHVSERRSCSNRPRRMTIGECCKTGFALPML